MEHGPFCKRCGQPFARHLVFYDPLDDATAADVMDHEALFGFRTEGIYCPTWQPRADGLAPVSPI